jgi:hypothetical protein
MHAPLLAGGQKKRGKAARMVRRLPRITILKIRRAVTLFPKMTQRMFLETDSPFRPRLRRMAPVDLGMKKEHGSGVKPLAPWSGQQPRDQVPSSTLGAHSRSSLDREKMPRTTVAPVSTSCN